MQALLQTIIVGAQQRLDEAKQRRNWGGIGDFYLNYADCPEAAYEQNYETLLHDVQAAFQSKGEPGILVQFFPEEDRLRIGVIRTNKND